MINLSFELFLLDQEGRGGFRELQELRDEISDIWDALPTYQRNLIKRFASSLNDLGRMLLDV